MDANRNNAELVNALSNELADAVERIGPALVLVNGRPRRPASGVVYAPGLILTADHVVEREEELTVQAHDGRTLDAQLVGRDPGSDLALLKVTDPALTAAAAAPDPARVGQLVLAVGRPSPEGPMASLGVVSASGGPLRTRRGAALEKYIQTDAIPYPGFSGGPLLDVTGRVLGIVTTGLIPGVALAVPAALAWQVADSLTRQGYVKRGFLGISSQPVAIPTSQRGGREQDRGLLIVRVEESSPADRGGLMLGDILVALDRQVVSDTDDLQALLTGDRVGGTVAVDVIRGGAVVSVPVTIGQRGA